MDDKEDATFDELELLKANLGISSKSRDTYLQTILDAVERELEDEKGIDPTLTPKVYEMFVIDYAAWRYRNRGEGVMPRNLQYRLHNLIVHTLGKGGQSDA